MTAATTLSYLAALAIGYLLGCSNMAFYLSRLRGVDLRQHGSRNLGTCNTFLTLGLPAAVLVFLHDAGKAVLAIVLSRLLFPGLPIVGFAAGSAAVIGHIFPFYLRFRGGKGFASFLGMSLILNWRFFVVILIAVALLTWITDYIVIGTAVTVIAFPIVTALLTHSLLAVAFVLADTLVILFKHRGNFLRIINGTEIGLRRNRAS